VLPDLRYCSGICLEGLKKLKKNLIVSWSMVTEVNIACFEILYWHLPGGTEETQEKPQGRCSLTEMLTRNLQCIKPQCYTLSCSVG